jgi:Sulfotransferase family
MQGGQEDLVTIGAREPGTPGDAGGSGTLGGRPPVIIIGMHRSGTSMLSQALEKAGLFLGWRQLPEHQEATFFLRLNMWVMLQASAGWEAPDDVRYVIDRPKARAAVVEYLRFATRSPRASAYLGPARYARHRSIGALDEPWGWKDPRTTFTLPLWLDVFPDAKVVHVMRHGVDVAESLRARQAALENDGVERFRRQRRHHLFRTKLSELTPGMRFASLDEGLDLWARYTEVASAAVAELGERRAFELRYEDFLAAPTKTIVALAEFCGLTDTSTASAAVAHLDDSRAFAFRHSDELRDFAEQRADRLAPFGY